MKRMISAILLVAVLCLGLAVSAYAAAPTFTVSEDYQTVSLNGKIYTRANTNSLGSYGSYSLEKEPWLTETQEEELGGCEFYINETRDFLEADFYFRDGSSLSVGYVTEELKHTLEEIRSNNDLELVVDFEWPDDNWVTTTVNDLMGTPKVLSGQTLTWSQQYDVRLWLQEDMQYVNRGYVLEESGRFYYVDIHENGLDYKPYWLPADSESVNAYVITDPELLAQLGDALDARDTVNSVFNDDGFTDRLSAVVMAIVFGLLPTGICVLSLILSIRSKGYYRVIWGTTAGLAAAVLLTYIGFVILVLTI